MFISQVILMLLIFKSYPERLCPQQKAKMIMLFHIVCQAFSFSLLFSLCLSILPSFLLLHFSYTFKNVHSYSWVVINIYKKIIYKYISISIGLLWWFSDEESSCQCRRLGFNPWVRKIPWRRKWQPTPVFLPGEFH